MQSGAASMRRLGLLALAAVALHGLLLQAFRVAPGGVARALQRPSTALQVRSVAMPHTERAGTVTQAVALVAGPDPLPMAARPTPRSPRVEASSPPGDVVAVAAARSLRSRRDAPPPTLASETVVMAGAAGATDGAAREPGNELPVYRTLVPPALPSATNCRVAARASPRSCSGSPKATAMQHASWARAAALPWWHRTASAPSTRRASPRAATPTGAAAAARRPRTSNATAEGSPIRARPSNTPCRRGPRID